MTREALAEILCNCAGEDPNNETAFTEALLEADGQLADAANDPSLAWWVEPETVPVDFG